MLIGRIVWAAALLQLVVSGLLGQDKTGPSRSRPTPQVAGRFMGGDTARGIIQLQYVRNSRPQRFIGATQSTCMMPAGSKPGESKPLNLSTIPLGSAMTMFYVSHSQNKKVVNVILALRFDSVPAGSALPVGLNIPCFKASDAPASK